MSNKTKPKPRVMWAIYDEVQDPIVTGNRELISICGRSAKKTPERVAVIPLDDVEAIVERAKKAHHAAFDHWISSGLDETWHPLRAALTAAGIPCKQRRARK